MKIITHYLAKTLNLSKEQEEVIYYGLFVVVTNVFCSLTVLFIGFCLNQLFYTFLLQLFYTPLRLYMGGYHSKTPLNCFISYNSIYFVFIMIMSYLSNNLMMDIITFILLFMILIDIYYHDDSKKKKIKLALIIIHLLLIPMTYKITIHYIFVLSIDINILLYSIRYLQNKFKK